MWAAGAHLVTTDYPLPSDIFPSTYEVRAVQGCVVLLAVPSMGEVAVQNALQMRPLGGCTYRPCKQPS